MVQSFPLDFAIFKKDVFGGVLLEPPEYVLGYSVVVAKTCPPFWSINLVRSFATKKLIVVCDCRNALAEKQKKRLNAVFGFTSIFPLNPSSVLTPPWPIYISIPSIPTPAFSSDRNKY